MNSKLEKKHNTSLRPFKLDKNILNLKNNTIRWYEKIVDPKYEICFKGNKITENTIKEWFLKKIEFLKSIEDASKTEEYNEIETHDIGIIFSKGNTIFTIIERWLEEKSENFTNTKKRFLELAKEFCYKYYDYIEKINDYENIKPNELEKISTEIYSKILLLNKLLLDTINWEELKEKEKIDTFYNAFKEIIYSFFANHLWRFNISRILWNNEFYDEDIKFEKDIEEVYTNKNLFRYYQNVVINISEHAFWEDFIWNTKKLSIIGKFNEQWDYVFSFKDNWRGMNSEELENVFIKWKTIKKEKKWHWLAMHYYKEQMQEFWWDITAESDWLWKGSTFIMHIPSSLIID